MAGPVVVAAAMSHLPAGLAASPGSLLVGSVSPGASFKEKTKALLEALAPAVVVLIVAALLTCIRPILKIRNYIAYSTVITPVVILTMDAGHPVEMSVVIDRLIATLPGATLVIAANCFFTDILDQKQGSQF